MSLKTARFLIQKKRNLNMKLNKKCCELELTTKNSRFIGRQKALKHDLLLFNCPKCNTTKAFKPLQSIETHPTIQRKAA